jgi:putative salt-induced outer membrane protein YdiY
MIPRFTVLFTTVLLVPLAFADQVTLTNGDRITGTIEKSDGKTLTLKTDLAGTIEIQWSGIKELISEAPLAVTTTEAPQPYSGTVMANEGTVTITTAPGASQTVPQADVKALRSPAEQEAYEKSLHPVLYRGWNGGLNLGFALTGGNSETTSLAIAFKAARPTPTDKLSLFADAVYAKNNAPGADPSTTANNVDGGIRYDRNITARLFGFANAAFQTNDLQDLNLRSLFGGGLGLHAIKSERTTLDLLGGANYTRESYTTLTRNFAALQVGDEFTHKFGAGGTSLVQKFFFFPDMNTFGEYYTTFDLGTVTKLNKWLGWQNSFSDTYVTNPPLGKKKNDIIFTTGLNISFAH